MDYAIVGIPAAVLVALFVEFLKRQFKIEGDFAIPMALAVGVGVAVLAELALIWPAFGDWLEVVVAGLLMGFAACGLFDLGQATKKAILPR